LLENSRSMFLSYNYYTAEFRNQGMSEFFGYGEDAFTLWALKNKKKMVLEKFNDKSAPSDCLNFYRPSFGRSGGKQSAEFGEFDAILVSLENVYYHILYIGFLFNFRKKAYLHDFFGLKFNPKPKPKPNPTQKKRVCTRS
jgi:hypothetical protein